MKLLNVALKDLLRSFRSMFFLMFGLGTPLLMTAIFYFAFGGLASDEGPTMARVAVQVVNLDESAAAYGDLSTGQMLVDFLQSEEMGKLLEVTEAADPASARAAVDSQEAAVAIIIPENLSAALVSPDEEAEVEIYQDPTLTVGPSIVRAIVTQFVDTLSGTKITVWVTYEQLSARGATISVPAMQEAAEQYWTWSVAQSQAQATGTNPWLTIQSPAGEEEDTAQIIQMISRIMAGMMAFYSFFTGAASAMSILQEEENGTLPRLFTTPTSQATILGGKLISVFALVIVQLTVLMAASSLIFGTNWGAPLPAVMVVTSLVALASSFGIFITSWLKDTKQTGIIYGGVMTVMGMIGISPVFTANIPNASQTVTILPLVVPQGWAMHGLQLTMDGAGAVEVLLPVAVMLGLSAIFFTVGVLKFKKRFA